MARIRQETPKTQQPHFATLLLMALAPEEVGLRIRKARLEKGWTHEELASRMSVNWRTVQRWQKGDLPRLGTLMRLAEEFELPSSYFVETVDQNAMLEQLAAEVAELRRGMERLLARLPDDEEPPREVRKPG
jgi:transcriptional regulator with XRE-family HTH domain